MGINDKNKNTISNKIRKKSGIEAYITQKIDGIQEVKRLSRYLTKTPLSSKGKNLLNEVVEQPDLIQTLTKDNSEGIKCLYTMSFKDGLINDKVQPLIFVHSYTGKFGYSAVGDIQVMVDILVPSDYDELKYIEEKRMTEIACYIADELDDTFIDDEYWVEKLGNLKIHLDSYDEYRLAKTNNISVFSMKFIVQVPTMRVNK